MLLNKKAVKNLIKTINPEIRVSTDFYAVLNFKINETIVKAVKNNGSRRTVTGAELKSGSDFGMRPPGKQ